MSGCAELRRAQGGAGRASKHCRPVRPPQGRMTMSEKSAAYAIVPFPPLQRQTIDWLELNRRRHMMYGLIEVDVTDVRRAIREYRARNGAPLSLTTFIIHCLARAVDADK